MDKKQTLRLTRPLQEMSDTVRKALREKGVMEAYLARPPYQRNDYLGWILRAKLTPTREKRLAQMLDELARGNLYMKMKYQPKRVRKEEA